MKRKAETTKRGPRAASILGEVRRVCQLEILRIDGERFPMVRYQSDPVAFVREQIGEEPLDHQAEIMLAVAGSSTIKVAVRSGQKQGKTKLVIWLAWWFWSCFPNARVFMTADTAPQVNRVLWVELKSTARIAKKNGCDFGEIPQNPEKGIESLDGRTLQGFTTRTIEAMAGLSGANMLFIGDEASSFETNMAEAIEGNTAGAARIIWISNPTRAEGPFFDAFHTKKRFWKIYHLDSEVLAAKVAAGLVPRVPGIATPEVIAKWKEEYGEDSPFYLVRVKGNFLLNEQAKIISLHHILESQKRWEITPDNEGPLSMGVDAAGDSGEGDEWAFSIVRGLKQLGLYTFRGLSEEEGIAHAQNFLAEHRVGDETPRVVIDAEGPIGSAFYGRMRALSLHLQIHNPGLAFECVGLKGSMPARREPMLYERIRDELWVCCAQWIRGGGAIITDRNLEQELYAPGWGVDVKGKRKATHKDILREKLGRSPDRADSLTLATWAPSAWVPDHADLPREEKNVGPGADTDNDANEGLDPYAGSRDFNPWS